MKDLLLIRLRKFLETRLVPNQPILLGYSGGPDSKTLLHLLIECRRVLAFDLHLVHIDHGWREESRREADEVQAEADTLGLPLHLKRLEPKNFSVGNLEEQGRNHRLRFFYEIYNQLGSQALLLGHHADDQAEVVLKRVFEGASLSNLGGLMLETMLLAMCIWRPLLLFQKKEMTHWLSQKKLSYFHDPTNSSKQFLRGRMREEMLPVLQASFGKEVSSNLCRLGEESREIKEYFCHLNKPILASIRKEQEESRLDLNAFLPLPKLQLKYLLVEWMRKEAASFSRQILDGVVLTIVNRLSKKKFQSNAGSFLISEGVVCFSNSKIVSKPKNE